MKKLLFLAVFLPFLAFAADSVEINGVSVQGQTATANGTSVYDTSSFTSVAFDSNEAIITSDTSWNVSNVLKAGTHIVNASVGAENATFTFDIHSGEGGLRQCQLSGECPTFGMFAPEIPKQTGIAPKSNNRISDGTLVTIQNLFELLAKGMLK
jgi:hypothetical protein